MLFPILMWIRNRTALQKGKGDGESSQKTGLEYFVTGKGYEVRTVPLSRGGILADCVEAACNMDTDRVYIPDEKKAEVVGEKI